MVVLLICCHGCTLTGDSRGGFLALAWAHPRSQMLWSVLLPLELILRSWTLWFEFQSVQKSSTEPLLLSECSQAQLSKRSSTASRGSNKPATNGHQTLVYRRQTSPMASTGICQQINSNSSYKCNPAHSSQICCYFELFQPRTGCCKEHLWFNPSGQLRSTTVKWENLLVEIQTI